MNRRLLLFGLSAALLPADEKPRTETEGFWNGRMWKQLTSREKAIFVRAMHDGVVYVSAAMRGMSDPAMKTAGVAFQNLLLPTNASYAEMADKIDWLYRDPANVLIPTVEMFRVSVQSLNGATSKETEATLDELRKEAQ